MGANPRWRRYLNARPKGRFGSKGLRVTKATASYDVFLSYSTADAEAAIALQVALEGHGLSVFRDEPSIRTFDGISPAVNRGINESKCFVALISDSYQRSRPCTSELSAAFVCLPVADDRLERLFVIPYIRAGVLAEDSLRLAHPTLLQDMKLLAITESSKDADASAAAAELARRLRPLRGPLGFSKELPRPRWYPPPPRPGSTRFTGRLMELFAVFDLLHSDEVALTTRFVKPGRVQVRGIAGSGKTLLTEEYALRFRGAYPGGIFWLKARESLPRGGLDSHSPPTALREPGDDITPAADARLLSELQTIATALITEDSSWVTEHSIVRLRAVIADAISRGAGQALWVVDDLPPNLSASQAAEWLCPAPDAVTLITSQGRDYGALCSAVDVDELDSRDAYALLALNNLMSSETEVDAAHAIVRQLGSHALALDLVSSTVASRRDRTFTGYYQDLCDTERDVLELAAELSDSLPYEHGKSISAALALAIAEAEAPARDVLDLGALTASVPLPFELVSGALARMLGFDGPAADEHAARAIRAAERMSLVEPHPDGSTSVHALVTRTVHFQGLDDARRAAVEGALVDALSKVFCNNENELELPALSIYAAHAAVVCDRARLVDVGALTRGLAEFEFNRGAYASARTLLARLVGDPATLNIGRDPVAANLAGMLAATMEDAGDFDEAVAILRQIVDALAATIPPVEPERLFVARGNLAAGLRVQGRLTEAASLWQTVYEECREVLGAEAVTTLHSAVGLARVLSAQERVQPARDLLETTLDTLYSLPPSREHVQIGLDASQTLASELHGMGEWADAAETQEAVVRALESTYGEDHPRTIDASVDLAGMWADDGHHERAQALLDEIVPRAWRVSGMDSRRGLRTASALASVLMKAGAGAKARSLLEQVVSGYQRFAAEGDRGAVAAASDLIAAARSVGDLHSANSMGQQLVETTTAVFGPNSMPTVRVRANHAETIAVLGDARAASEVARWCHEVVYARFGEMHPETLTAANNLGNLLLQAGEIAAGRSLLEQTLASREQVLGDDHPDTVGSRGNLGAALYADGAFSEARELQQLVYEFFRTQFGDVHPETITAMNNLALTAIAQGDYAEASALLETALSTVLEAYGDRHPSTVQTLMNSCIAVFHSGDLVAARKLERRALELTAESFGEDHPMTLRVMSHRVSTLQAQGEQALGREDLAASQRFFRRAEAEAQTVYATRKRILGPTHLETLDAAGKLAGVLWALRDFGAARPLEELVLREYMEQLGPDHPDTVSARSSLAETLFFHGEFAEALEMEVEVLCARERLLGPTHPDTLNAADLLSVTLLSQGERASAQRLKTFIRRHGTSPES